MVKGLQLWGVPETEHQMVSGHYWICARMGTKWHLGITGSGHSRIWGVPKAGLGTLGTHCNGEHLKHPGQRVPCVGSIVIRLRRGVGWPSRLQQSCALLRRSSPYACLPDRVPLCAKLDQLYPTAAALQCRYSEGPSSCQACSAYLS
jgi:hypothetical protein